MMEKKQEQAIRIYEALSGVDPDLLQRSEKEKKEQKVVSLWRFTRPLAACLVLFAAGGLCLVTLRSVGGVKNAATNSESAMDAFNISNNHSASMSGAPSAAAEAENKMEEKPDYSDQEQSEVEMAEEASAIGAEGEYAASSGNSIRESKSVEDYSRELWSIVTDKLKVGTHYKEGMAFAEPEASTDEPQDRPSWQADEDFREFCLGKTMLIRLGEEERLLDLEQSGEAQELLWEIAHYELSECAEEKNLDEGISLEILDENGSSVQTFTIFNRYLKLGEYDGIFEVTGEGYDYEELQIMIRNLLGK